MRFPVVFLIVLSAIAVAVAGQAPIPKASGTAATKLVGRWQVKFIPAGGDQKNLVFTALAKGSGSFLLLDTGPVTNQWQPSNARHGHS